MRALTTALCAAALVAASPHTGLAQVNPSTFGTWQLNLAQSVFMLGPPPMAQTQVWEPAGEGVTVSVETVPVAGVRIAYGYTANVDGVEYPIEGDLTPNGAETIALESIDAQTTVARLRRTGEVVLTTRIRISSDGRTLTLTSSGTNRNEQPTHSVMTFDRQ
jgi:hypothetical protein